jgi:formamidopyrimidine-DNA glycosylase
MPELPEVETVRRGLDDILTGHRIEAVHIDDSRLVQPRSSRAVERRLAGATVTSVGRRGKWLLLELDTGDTAVHHLRMTGSFAVDGETLPHERLQYVTDAHIVRYVDPRRFGTLEVGKHAVMHSMLDSKLGPEPLEAAWDATVLRTSLRGRSTTIKAALLDQRVVAGLGNIYVDEALHGAGIAPRVRAGTLSLVRAERLVVAVREVLTLALDSGGSTLSDYRQVDGTFGSMQDRFLVYGRAGEPCAHCGRALRSATIAGRTTVWCTHCQR